MKTSKKSVTKSSKSATVSAKATAAKKPVRRAARVQKIQGK